jgi:hypothetical protein
MSAIVGERSEAPSKQPVARSNRAGRNRVLQAFNLKSTPEFGVHLAAACGRVRARNASTTLREGDLRLSLSIASPRVPPAGTGRGALCAASRANRTNGRGAIGGDHELAGGSRPVSSGSAESNSASRAGSEALARRPSASRSRCFQSSTESRTASTSAGSMIAAPMPLTTATWIGPPTPRTRY